MVLSFYSFEGTELPKFSGARLKGRAPDGGDDYYPLATFGHLFGGFGGVSRRFPPGLTPLLPARMYFEPDQQPEGDRAHDYDDDDC